MGLGSALAWLSANVWCRVLSVLLVYLGVSVLALISVIVTGAFTTLSILLFGARPKEEGRDVSRQRSPSVILATDLLLLVGGLFACSSQHDQNEDRRREMEAVERKIVPLDALVLARSGPVQAKWSITATWDIETKMDRVEYSKWVTSQLVPEFKIVKADESQLTLSKLTDGDTNSIECKFALTNARLHVHAVFGVSPD